MNELFQLMPMKEYYFNFSENLNFPDKGVTGVSHNLTTWLALTKKIQMNFTYSGNRGDNQLDSFSYFLSWRVASKISTKFSYNKSNSEGESRWNSLISLNVSF